MKAAALGVMDVAIIGMSGRFPGAPTIASFWRNVANGRESILFFTDEELLGAGVDPADLRNPRYVKAAALLDGVELFDADFFGIRPVEAAMMDPQHRLFLECAWEALESAGYDPERYEGEIGVYAGSNPTDYLTRARANAELFNLLGEFQAHIANGPDYLTTRVSYKLNLKGPSVVVQTACSTSLVAIHTACQAVLNRECDMALAGGVGISKLGRSGYLYEPGGKNSPDGHCRAFDAKAQGTVGGCGLGIVVLKELKRALEDGDFVHAVIKGSAINNDGVLKASFTAPSVEGQAKAIAGALAVAGVQPATIGYVEAHGTGTPLGDPIEFAALTKAFRESTMQKGFCALGSVKANIGHLTAAAGVAGVIKTVMALKNATIPPSSYFRAPNPEIDLDNSPFYITATPRSWITNGSPRRAGVSSLGIGGTNAHIILEQAPLTERREATREWQLLPWSAKSASVLTEMTANLGTFLENNPSASLANAAYTLQVGRANFEHRSVLVCRDTIEAITALRSPDRESILRGVAPREIPLAIFLFPGGGAQRSGMGLEVYAWDRSFRNDVDCCCEILRPLLGFDLKDVLGFSGNGQNSTSITLNKAAIAHPALFTIEYCLAKLWMRWGIRPSGVIGHSLGEYAAATIAGVFTLEDALRIVVARGRLMEQVPPGIMLAVPLSVKDVKPFLNDYVSLAAINAPTSCILSGFADAVIEVEQRLTNSSVECRRLAFSHASHSPMMDPILKDFAVEVSRCHPKAPEIPLMSNLTGTWLTPKEATDPEYWSNHLRRTVRFSDGLDHVLNSKTPVLLEVGPGRTIEKLIKRQGPEFIGRKVLSSLGAPEDGRSEISILLGSLGECWLSGMRVDWEEFNAAREHQRMELPTYPFERKRYWMDQPGLPGSGPLNKSIEQNKPLLLDARNLSNASYRVSHIPDAKVSPLPQSTQTAITEKLLLPQTGAVEARLIETVAKLFGYDAKKVNRTANFLELGADSLLLMRLTAAIEDQFGVTVPFRFLMIKYPTITGLADHLAEVLLPKSEDATFVSISQPVDDQCAVSLVTSPASRVNHEGPSDSLTGIIMEQLRIMSAQIELLNQPAADGVTAHAIPQFPQVSSPAQASLECGLKLDGIQPDTLESDEGSFGPFEVIEPVSAEERDGQRSNGNGIHSCYQPSR